MARVLIADDAAFMRMMIRNMLTAGGHEVVAEAEDGAQAIEKFGAHLPDVVTMDITMPVMDGIEAVRGIKALHPEAKILMCSAMGQQAMVMDAVKAGARGFLVKPLNAAKLLEEIERLFSS